VTVFLDTVGLLAVWDESDQWHRPAQVCFSELLGYPADLVTSSFVLLECGNAAARRPYRSAVARLRREMEMAHRLIVPTIEDFEAAWLAYERGEADSAGIVDHVSFTIMRRLGLSKAFTNDGTFAPLDLRSCFEELEANSKWREAIGSMMTIPTADEGRFLSLCATKGQESPDPRTKIGCLIVAPDGTIRCAACNDYPQGIPHGSGERAEAPLKYVWIEHAERNAIYLAARQGLCTQGCTMFIELTPCVECARAIIQGGIVHVVINQDRCAEYRGAKYSVEHPTALGMLAEAGVSVRFTNGAP